MADLLREDTPYSLRWVIAIGAIALAWYLWLFIFGGPAVPTTLTATAGVIVLIGAFLTLGVLRTSRTPLLPLWVTLAFVIVRAGTMMLSYMGYRAGVLPIVLGAIILAAIAIGMLIQPRRGIAVGLSVLLALVGAYAVAIVPIAVSSVGGARFKGTTAPVGILGAACLAAGWHALRSRGESHGAVR